jgi:hypothetical protein
VLAYGGVACEGVWVWRNRRSGFRHFVWVGWRLVWWSDAWSWSPSGALSLLLNANEIPVFPLFSHRADSIGDAQT